MSWYSSISRWSKTSLPARRGRGRAARAAARSCRCRVVEVHHVRLVQVRRSCRRRRRDNLLESRSPVRESWTATQRFDGGIARSGTRAPEPLGSRFSSSRARGATSRTWSTWSSVVKFDRWPSRSASRRRDSDHTSHERRATCRARSQRVPRRAQRLSPAARRERDSRGPGPAAASPSATGARYSASARASSRPAPATTAPSPPVCITSWRSCGFRSSKTASRIKISDAEEGSQPVQGALYGDNQSTSTRSRPATASANPPRHATSARLDLTLAVVERGVAADEHRKALGELRRATAGSPRRARAQTHLMDRAPRNRPRSTQARLRLHRHPGGTYTCSATDAGAPPAGPPAARHRRQRRQRSAYPVGPRPAIRSRNGSAAPSSRTPSISNAAATASRVTSSGVPPSPPVDDHAVGVAHGACRRNRTIASTSSGTEATSPHPTAERLEARAAARVLSRRHRWWLVAHGDDHALGGGGHGLEGRPPGVERPCRLLRAPSRPAARPSGSLRRPSRPPLSRPSAPSPPRALARSARCRARARRLRQRASSPTGARARAASATITPACSSVPIPRSASVSRHCAGRDAARRLRASGRAGPRRRALVARARSPASTPSCSSPRGIPLTAACSARRDPAASATSDPRAGRRAAQRARRRSRIASSTRSSSASIA